MFSDTHIHLCPGLDDGPRDLAESLEMLHLAWNEGIRAVAVTAHQNESWQVTPAEIRSATERLQLEMDELGCQMLLAPAGEVMMSADLVERLEAGELMTYGGHGRHLLVEYPHGLFVDFRGMARKLVELGVTPVIAHAERYRDLIQDRQIMRGLIESGCLIQVTTSGMDEMAKRPDGGRGLRVVRDWFRRGWVHVMGTDAHRLTYRPPSCQPALRRVIRWIGPDPTATICERNGLALLQGTAITPPPPRPRSFFSRT